MTIILLSGAETFFKQGEGTEYLFYFTPKFAKHLHQPVLLMGVGSCTFSLVI